MFTNANSGALTALQMLGGTTQAQETVQEEIATGKSISSAQDNAALWAISQVMQADVAGFSALSDSLSLNEATVTVAAVGAEYATDILVEMKQLAITATGANVDHGKIEAQMAQKTEQLNSIISASQFNGVNLLRTDVDGNGSTSLTVATSLDRQGSTSPVLSTLSVDGLDLEGSASFDINNRTTITDGASALTALGEIEGFLQYAVDGAAALGASASRISDQNDYLGKLSDAMRMGISNLTDANLEEVATRMIALEVQHQLGVISLSIANSASERLLQLNQTR